MARTTYKTPITNSAQILAGKGILSAMFVGSVGTTGTVKLYDSLSATATVIVDTHTLIAGYNNLGNIECLTGCYAELAGTPSVTFLTLAAD